MYCSHNCNHYYVYQSMFEKDPDILDKNARCKSMSFEGPMINYSPLFRHLTQ